MDRVGGPGHCQHARRDGSGHRAAGGSYQRPAADGSRPGIFYANTYDLSARPSWGVEALFLHEAAPGHHFQLALQQETEELPRFRRFGSYTAYVEGWGLYAEYLGQEMGIYEDPYARFGAYAAELWRAIRLVVDTGLHYHGWSREDVLEYMYANSPAAEARAVSEAERYMAIPSQALGDDFGIREFHARVLETGAVPLDVLEAHVMDWVEDLCADWFTVQCLRVLVIRTQSPECSQPGKETSGRVATVQKPSRS
ncbi:DUF885 domain-containing protein [Wenzhouxiangella sp. AB-CW3]|uniref:DUF885 domain-containing protein n=1 Tax=Wenzhouxiangella sp. AB-CW3 TaxID=2771012 RepID=UPI0021E06EC9|nr:DUF885 domain-containing protein [Wenzhouxiangella sp. AB-CW3]